MSMKRTGIACIATAVVASGAITATVVSQHDKTMDEAQMMAAWQAYAKVGPQQQQMLNRCGSWKAVTKMWEYPGSDPTTSTCTAEVYPIMDGRFVVEDFQGQFAWGEHSMMLNGRGTLGFNNQTREYQFTWLDNMGTGMQYSTGTMDGNTLTLTGDKTCCMRGGTVPMKAVTTYYGNDKALLEMYDKNPDGSWWKNFEITYTRID